MKPSPLRHPVAVLRQICGMYQQQFADEIADCSRIYLQKIEQTPAHGGQKISERLAMRIAHETGVAVSWLLAGDPSIPPTDSAGQPYTAESFEWHRAGAKNGNPRSRSVGFPFVQALKIVGIGSAAGDKGKAALFLWRLRKFFDECAHEFGFHVEARAAAEAMLRESKLTSVCFHDKGFDFTVLNEKRVVAALKNAKKGKAPGAPVEVAVRLPPAKTKRSSRRRRRKA